MTRDCLTSDRTYVIGVDFPTIQEAWDRCRDTLDLCGHNLTFQIRGDIVGASTLRGPMVGQVGAESVRIQGEGYPGLYTVSDNAGGCCFIATEEARFGVNCLTLKSPGGAGLTSAGGVIIARDIWFDEMNTCIDAAGPRAVVSGAGSLTWLFRNFNHGCVAEDHALITLGCQVNMSGAPNFAGAFCQGDLGGMIDGTGMTLERGSATGKRFNAFTNGIVFTGTAGGHPDFYPGNLPGGVESGGIYQ